MITLLKKLGMIRILLVDDNTAVRRGWRLRFGLEADIEIVGEAGNGVEVQQAAADLAPDVILMDVEMPVMDGITAVSTLRAHHMHVPVVMISIYDDVMTRRQALAAGATAFVGKDEPFDRLLSAMRQAAVHS